MMSLGTLLLVLVVFFGFGSMIVVFLFLAGVFPGKKEGEKTEEWEREILRVSHQRKIEWNKRVRSAKDKYPLTDDPASKEAFVKELFGDEVPKYLFYEVERELTEDELQRIIEYCWDGYPDFGDLEVHHTLRVRNAKRFTALLIGELPLVQVGHCQPWEVIDEEGFPEGVIDFRVMS